MSGLYGNVCGGFGNPKTYVLTDENGKEITGVLVDNLTVFTATPEDVRSGKVFAGDEGVKTGTNTSMTGGGIEDVEWHQCPQLVRNYLSNVTYDSSDYSTSSIETYADGTVLTNPIGKEVGGVTYYNQEPNVGTPFVNESKAGTLKPLDSVRWIKSPSRNVRDLGGWTCDGGTVKYGKLFRGGEISASDTDFIKTMHDEIGIRAELELQGTDVTEDYSVIGTDVDFCCPTDGGAYWAYYSISNTASMKKAFRFIFDSVMRDRPLYFHCSAGADRTGTIACLIEALLGVSQSDIDKDYELASFNGADYLRKRCGREYATGQWEYGYKNLITAIMALTAGSTFKDKVINYIASLGFTANEINAFRAAMINGTPETVAPIIATYTVTNTLSNVNSSNTTLSASQYQSYTATITPNNNYVIDSVKVTMGGVDVTANVWDGNIINLYNLVTLNLTGCTSDNVSRKVIRGQSYAANISVADGYTFDGAAVSITMGGEDMSTYYAEGKIAIPEVTGDIVITITAMEQQNSNLFNYANATSYAGAGSAWTEANDSSTHGYKQDGMLVSIKNRGNNLFGWTCDTLKNLPAGTYTFKGEFKQDATNTSAIMVYNTTTDSSSRLLKYSLSVGDTWTAFEYNFTLTSTAAVIYICGQNDDTSGGKAYLRNVEVISK